MASYACKIDSGANACVFNHDLDSDYKCGVRDPNKEYKTKIIDQETGKREITKMNLFQK